MAVSLNTALGAFPITALAGTSYVPLAGGTMTGALTIASGTLTASAPALNVTQTWTTGAAFTGALINITDTSSTAGSLLQDWQVGGTSKASIAKNGLLTAGFGIFGALTGTGSSINYFNAGIRSVSAGEVAWTSGNVNGAMDLALYRDAAAVLAQRNGTAAQTLRVYSTYTDASNFERLSLSTTAGSSVNITAETLGTGGDNLDIVLTPAGTGSVKFPSGASVDSSGVVTGAAFVTASAGYFGGVVIGYPSSDAAFLRGSAGQIDVTNGTANTYRDLKLRNLLSTGYVTIDSGTLTASAPALSITQTWNQGATAFTGALIDITNTASSSASRAIDVRIAGASIFSVRPDGYAIASVGLFVGSGGTNGLWDSVGPHVKSTGAYSWAQSANATDTSDLFLYRDAAATLAQRNGTTQQIFRLYNTYTDASNYERLTLTGVAGTSVNITAETLGTGADNIDIVLTPAGTGGVVVANSKKLTAVNIGTYATEDSCTLHAYNAYGLIFEFGSAKKGYMNTDGFKLAAANYYGWVSDTDPVGSAADTALFRNAAGVVEVNNGTAGTFRDVKLRNLIQTEYHELTEMTAPSAPAANSVRIYAEDNGSGKTRLMALFATGAAQQIAIEP